MASDSERRQFSRVSFHTEATISQQDKTWCCELLDMSIKGVLVKEPDNFDAIVSQPLMTKITLSDAAVIEMTVEIARREDDKIGLTCINIDVESIAHLRRLVELNLGVPDAAERELHELIAHYEPDVDA